MDEIYHFKVYKADATVKDNGLVVRLFYPRNPQPIDRRLDEDLPFGVKVLEDLISEGRAELATFKNPLKPASGASLYVLSDGSVVFHRRDKGAPTHKLYHSGYGGYTRSREFVYTAKGLFNTALQEISEECMLITRDRNPWLIVPNDCKDYTIETAKRLGLDFGNRYRYVNAEIMDPTDTLEVYDEDGNQIFTTKAFLEFIRESQTSFTALWIRHLPLSSEEILPVDTEGMIRDEKFIYFNRESYVAHLKSLANKKFGDILETPDVYHTRIQNNVPVPFTPDYSEPYFGPDGIEVTHPHVWAPEDMMIRSLDALGVDGYRGKWLEMELWKEKSKLESKSLLPQSIIKVK